jgi:uncharacterized repeat protein (TIGR03847 family)
VGAAFDLGDIDAFTTVAVGRPGQRVFHLQARRGDVVVSLRCEKQQVAALAAYLARMLADLPTPDDQPGADARAVHEPLIAQWPVGPISVAYDDAADRVVVLLEELLPSDGGEDELDPLVEAERGSLRVRLTRGQALAFAAHARAVVEAGRPLCRFCGRPIDPDGHPCPRMN